MAAKAKAKRVQLVGSTNILLGLLINSGGQAVTPDWFRMPSLAQMADKLAQSFEDFPFIREENVVVSSD